MECNSQGWGEGHYEGMTSHKLLKHNSDQGAKTTVGPTAGPRGMLALCSAAQVESGARPPSPLAGVPMDQGWIVPSELFSHCSTHPWPCLAVLGAAAASGLGSVASVWPPLNRSVPPSVPSPQCHPPASCSGRCFHLLQLLLLANCEQVA